MNNLFPIAVNDQSVNYLGMIFGQVSNVLAAPASGGSPLLGAMYYILNGMALSVGVLIIVYSTVVGIMATAHEGEFMGKKWSGLWVPIRMVLGVVAVFPHASGYSSLQVIIMWVILQGVGAADKLWSTALATISITGSPYAGIQLDTTGIQNTIKQIFQASVCQASMMQPTTDSKYSNLERDDQKNKLYYCGDASHSFLAPCTTTSFVFPKDNTNPGGYPFGANGECGTLYYCNPQANANATTTDVSGKIKQAACEAQNTALAEIIPNMGKVAQGFVALDNEYYNFTQNTSYQGTLTIDAGGAQEPTITRQGTNQTPMWIQTYCDSKQITKCCYTYALYKYSNVPFLNFGLDHGPTYPRCPGTENFLYPAYTQNGSGVDLTNTGTKAVQTLYPLPLMTMLNNTDFINASLKEYTSSIQVAVSAIIASEAASAANQQNTPGGINADLGWILAGGYYYQLATMQGNNLSSAIPDFAMTSPDRNAEIFKFRNNYDAAGEAISAIQSQASGARPGQDALPPEAGRISQSVKTAASSLLSTFIGNMSGCTNPAACAENPPANPLASVSMMGYNLMVGAQTLFAVIVVLVAGLTAAFTINVMALGTGMTMNPLGEMLKSVMGLISPFFVALIAGMFSLGALLGIYLPMIPFIIYSVAAIGWMIGVIEAMTAAPLIALGILSPGGHHEILGKAEPALLMLFNLFLRPSLMVFGMMTSMLLAVVAIQLINSAFLFIAQTIISAPGLFETLIFISIYTSLVITAFNKAFSLIYVIPDRVITWIGGHATSGGEAEAVSAGKHAAEGSAGASSGAGKESGAAAGGVGTKGRHATDEAEITTAGKGLGGDKKSGSNIGGNNPG